MGGADVLSLEFHAACTFRHQSIYNLFRRDRSSFRHEARHLRVGWGKYYSRNFTIFGERLKFGVYGDENFLIVRNTVDTGVIKVE